MSAVCLCALFLPFFLAADVLSAVHCCSVSSPAILFMIMLSVLFVSHKFFRIIYRVQLSTDTHTEFKTQKKFASLDITYPLRARYATTIDLSRLFLPPCCRAGVVYSEMGWTTHT